jgi:hypothetical protein
MVTMLLSKDSLNLGTWILFLRIIVFGMCSCRKPGLDDIMPARFGKPSWASGRKMHIENCVRIKDTLVRLLRSEDTFA